MIIRPFKIRPTKRRSEIIQNILFKNGYKWIDNSDLVYVHNERFLVFSKDDDEDRPVLSLETTSKSYTSNKTKEIKFKDFMSRYNRKGVIFGR